MSTTVATFCASTFAGNWQRRTCFVWFEQPDNPEDFGLWILSHRDSGLIDQSNGAVIRKRMQKYLNNGDVIYFDCSHWAVGTTHEMAVRTYRSGTTDTTAAFDELAEIVAAIDDYAILDEGDYSEREYESAMEGIRLAVLGTDINWKSLPDGWEYEVYSKLDDRELENTDDHGAFPSTDAVKSALIDLGFIVK